MSIIKVTVDDQALYLTESPVVAAQGVNENYFQFILSADWSGFGVVALFWKEGNETDVYESVVDGTGKALVPHEVTANPGRICVGLAGVNGNIIHTSEILKYKVVKGKYTAGQSSEPPSPGIYEQMLSLAGQMSTQFQQVVQEQAEIIEDLQDDQTALRSELTAQQTTFQNTVSGQMAAFIASQSGDYGATVLWDMDTEGDHNGALGQDTVLTLRENVENFDFLEIWGFNTDTDDSVFIPVEKLSNSGTAVKSANIGIGTTKLRIVETRLVAQYNELTIAHQFIFTFDTTHTATRITQDNKNSYVSQFGITRVIGRKMVQNAELTDIRVGQNGTTYQTAGAAVRGQFTEVKAQIPLIDATLATAGKAADAKATGDAFTAVNGRLQELKTVVGSDDSDEPVEVTLEQGTLSSSSGNPSTNAGRVRTADFVNFTDIDYVFVDNSASVNVAFFGYETDGTFDYTTGFFSSSDYPSNYKLTREYIQNKFSGYPSVVKFKAIFLKTGLNPITPEDLEDYVAFGTAAAASGLVADVINLRNADTALQENIDEANVKTSKINSSWINGAKVSIIGDSISTYDGYLISGYKKYYPAGNVNSVDKTWWNKVLRNSGMTLEVNAAYSGSRATNTRASEGYPSFYDRCALLGSPDVIFVALGTNDSASSADLGTYDFNVNIADLDESKFRSAYIKGIKALQDNYPAAKIVALALTMKDAYRWSIQYIADYYSIPCISVPVYGYYSNPHPNADGMNTIAEAVINYGLKNEIESAYSYLVKNPTLEYEGERINIRNRYASQLLFRNGAGFQSAAAYGKHMVMLTSSSGINVFDLDSYDNEGTGQIADLSAHCNAATFGTEFYAEGDTYPLLYVNAYQNNLPKGTCYVVRLAEEDSTFTGTVVQTITVGFVTDPIWTDTTSTRTYGNFCIDRENGFLYALVLRDVEQVTRIFKFALPTISDGTEVTLTQADIIEYFDVDYLAIMQDCEVCNGKIFVMAGDASYPHILKVIDTQKKAVVSKVNLLDVSTAEPQSVVMYDGHAFLGIGVTVYRLDF